MRLLRFGDYRGGRNLPGAGGDRDVDADGCVLYHTGPHTTPFAW
jgi:hypothetical protein